MSARAEGFLIVLRKPDTYGVKRKERYKGVDRMPSYRFANQNPIAEEIAAMDKYILGDARDEDTGLIAKYETAVEICKVFGRSAREFELIWCRSMKKAGSGEEIPRPVAERLGFDVAGLGGDFWSIVADLPTEGPVARFSEKLNENGLFDKASDAWEYMREYQCLKLPDSDSPFVVLDVRRVE